MKEVIKYKYECTKCKFIFDEEEQSFSFKDLVVCPVCYAKKKFFKKIIENTTEELKLEEKEKTNAEIKKLKELVEEEKKIEKEKIAKEVLDYIYDEVIDLLDDLKNCFINGKISINRFQEIFYNASFKILDYRKKDYYPSNYFISNFRRIILDFNKEFDNTFYNYKIEQENIMYEKNKDNDQVKSSFEQKIEDEEIEENALKDTKHDYKDLKHDFKGYLKRTINKEN
jgi:rubredoxin